MDFPAGVGNPCGYFDEQHRGSHYVPDCSDYSYDAQEYCSNDYETCAGVEDQPRSSWEVLLEVCITEVLNHRQVTNKRLENLE